MSQDTNLLELSPVLIKQIEELAAERGADSEAMKSEVRKEANRIARVILDVMASEPMLLSQMAPLLREHLVQVAGQLNRLPPESHPGRTVDERLAALYELAAMNRGKPAIGDHAMERSFYYEDDD